MKVNGTEYNFNRMLKVEIINPGHRNNESIACVLEYCPYKNAAYCQHLEVKVIDLPSAPENDLPGYTAEIKIYNPDKTLISFIASNSKWLLTSRDDSQYNNASSEKKKTITTNNLQDYYKQRLQVKIYAGYYGGDIGETEEITAGYSHIFTGYINGSSITHSGTDDVLTLGAHDIMVDRMDVNAVTDSLATIVGDEFEKTVLTRHKEWYKGAANWDQTFKKYVRYFETEKIQNGKVVQTTVSDKGSNDWFRVLYVKSVKDYLNSRAGKGSGQSYISSTLTALLKTSTNPFERGAHGDMTWFYTDGRTLPSMLNELCSVDGLRVGWKRFVVGEEKLTYVVYPLGAGVKWGPVEKGDIQIYNYQNLLAAPSVNGAGCLDIKMLFNPECIPWRRIALVLTETLGKENGVADVSSFETHVDANGRLVGIMNATSLSPTVATNQVTGTLALASQRLEAEKKADGYMFNTGFPITKVVHTLSTHGASWSTQVSTVPMLRGIDMENKNG
jgi:hypothetical protein